MHRFMQRGMVILFASLCFLSSGVAALAQDIPSDYQEVLKALDRKGDFKAGVLKVNIPRNDLKMTIQGFSTPTPFGFGGWVALTKASDGSDVMMGDLVLLQEEVNPVLSALLDNGIDVTALHNHFFWDDPHVYFMHVHGMGKAADLARRVKPALDLIGHVKPEAAAPASTGGTALDTAKLAKIAGHEGEQTGALYKITVGRDDLGMKEHGATINARIAPLPQVFLNRVRMEGRDALDQPVRRLSAKGGEPCRDALRRAEPGEEVILASFSPFTVAGPYREFGPIFVFASEVGRASQDVFRIGAPTDYLRAVPTGPLAPLVVAATTCGDTLQLGLSYRRTAALAQRIDRIADSFANCVRSLQ